ncbi:nicotinate-nucleotide--dimethylbenzimidazole phosphoribosyltransferase [Candidatus Marithrix sp. Canyon 246]|uniref:nicotinate-nucleotide--dimethylbenzimidazole phosphoribosyltransferase n=1 Tax=Candidatus Marithrix sp. Canyon 246 TaxID=1827136 RepID=UPI00084A1638|nr:nicotinate-nucleotide--dimethylbenzimidazole phosphoribosyltransferase [Candidatus Marithrix sp. Canyon 246]
MKALQEKIDNKTKPLGALGELETLALQIGNIQNSLNPKLSNPTILVFAGDHGVEGVSAFPSEVTAQMVLNFLQGGAAINVFCQKHDIAIKIIDAGVNYDFQSQAQLIDAKIAKGTKNYLHDSAMTMAELDLCFDKSSEIIETVYQGGCNIIGFGEMGIANTSSASLIMNQLSGIPLEKCVGRGTGLNDEQFNRKLKILTQAQNNHPNLTQPKQILATFGGFEIAQICGAMLAAYQKNMLLMIDGFIASAAFLVAQHIEPKIQQNAIFCHLSDESGHKLLLDYLNAKPLLQLGMRLGEGTGCAVAYPIINSAVTFLNQMASFDSAGVSNKC